MLLERRRNSISVDMVRSRPVSGFPTLILRRDLVPRRKKRENPLGDDVDAERRVVAEIGCKCCK